MANNNSTITVNAQLIETLARLGVPTFILVVLLFIGVPRYDHGLMVADKVETEMLLIDQNLRDTQTSLAIVSDSCTPRTRQLPGY